MDRTKLRNSGGGLSVEPSPRKRYSLDELIAQCDPDSPLSEEDHAWLDDASQGREAL
jgi:antitoxin ChpS